MSSKLTLLAVFAHPDDETLGAGSTLARYAAEGVEVHLVTATRGERGWQGKPADNPGMDALGELRTCELYDAACVQGIGDVAFLDYVDGDLDRADPAEVTGKIVSHLRRVQPQVVLTFGPEGSYGHPDHIAISQLTAAAIVCAADGSYADPLELPAHRIAKLYYLVDSKRELEAVVPIIGDIVMPVDGIDRHLVGWEEWAITTRIDGAAYWRTVLRAARCHWSQMQGFPNLERWSDEQHRLLWAQCSYYRAFSLVNGGRGLEHDLFEGVR